MNILIVGAGAVGQVYGWHLFRAGASISFFAKEKYAENLRKGLNLHKLLPIGHRTLFFKDFRVLTHYEEVAAKKWDQVWLTMSSDALRSSFTTNLLNFIGDATIVSIQPDLEDGDTLRRLRPNNKLVQGAVSFSAFQSPLPGEKTPKAGIAYQLFPFFRGEFSGPEEAVQSVVSMLNKGHFPAASVPNLERTMAAKSALLICLIAGLEAEQWKLNRYLRSNRFQHALNAAQEVLNVVETRYGTDVSTLRILLKPRVWKVFLTIAQRVTPYNLENYLCYHFTKVSQQTRLMLNTYIKFAEQNKLEASALHYLLENLDQSARLVYA